MINTDKVYDVEIDSNGTPDRQKFSNCYISSAMYFDEEFHADRELLDFELEELQEEDSCWFHQQCASWYY